MGVVLQLCQILHGYYKRDGDDDENPIVCRPDKDGWYQQLVRGYGTTVIRGVDSRK